MYRIDGRKRRKTAENGGKLLLSLNTRPRCDHNCYKGATDALSGYEVYKSRLRMNVQEMRDGKEFRQHLL